MWDFFLQPENVPFMVALGVMLGLFSLEMISLLLGLGLSDIVDSMLPDFDVDGALDGAGAADGAADGFFSWLGLGQVPFVVFLVFLMTFFGVSGLLTQQIAQGMWGDLLNPWLASGVAGAVSLPLTGKTASFLGERFFKDETEAISKEAFIGQIATITLGETKKGKPTRAKFTDSFGTTHYLMVVPMEDGQIFRQGDEVVIVEKDGPNYTVISGDQNALETIEEPSASAHAFADVESTLEPVEEEPESLAVQEEEEVSVYK